MNPRLSAEIRPACRLKMLAIFEDIERALEQATLARQQRQVLLASIRDRAEDGEIALIWSGRDCDGVAYTGEVQIVEATARDVTEAVDHYYEWADGPASYRLERPSVARSTPYRSRDLVLEAFEDGHPHAIYDLAA